MASGKRAAEEFLATTPKAVDRCQLDGERISSKVASDDGDDIADFLGYPLHSRGRSDIDLPLIDGEPLSLAESARMGTNALFYFGNAAVDQLRNTGWFVGQFVPAELGLRHQTDVELKWGLHKDGEKRSRPLANGNATTISVLIRGGALRVTFDAGGTPQVVTLRKEGDYVVFGPDVVHFWEADGEPIVLSVRFPSVEVERPTLPAGG